MKKIWKYKLEPSRKINLPKGAKILTVQTQGEGPCLWALVAPEVTELEERRFGVYGTGHMVLDHPGTYVGTFQLAGGALVYHVFEEEKERR